MRQVPRGLEFLGLYNDPDNLWREHYYSPTWETWDLESQLEILAMGREPKLFMSSASGRDAISYYRSTSFRLCRQKGIAFCPDGVTMGWPSMKFGEARYRHDRPHNFGRGTKAGNLQIVRKLMDERHDMLLGNIEPNWLSSS